MSFTFFTELATLLDAGHSVSSALKVLKLPTSDWVKSAQMVEKGLPLSHAMYKSKIINAFELEVLKTGEMAGRLPLALRKLGKAKERREANIQRIKSKLWMPMAIFLVAIAVSFLLRLLANNGANASYFFTIALVQILVVIFAIRWLLSLFKLSAYELLERLSFFHESRWYQLMFQQTLFNGFAWLQESGIDAQSSFRKLAQQFRSKRYRTALTKVANDCGKGIAASASLQSVDLPIPTAFINLYVTAEASGTLTATLDGQLKLGEDELRNYQDTFADNFPRLIYACAILSSILLVFL